MKDVNLTQPLFLKEVRRVEIFLITLGLILDIIFIYKKSNNSLKKKLM